MIERIVVGDVPRKHHIQLRGPDNALRFEECFTRDGFDGPYTIMYHLERPQTQVAAALQGGWRAPVAAPPHALAKRHFPTTRCANTQGMQLEVRLPLLFNDDVIVGVAFPNQADDRYSVNADGDELIYIHQGQGTLRTPLGDVPFGPGDYVFVPRGLMHRYLLDDSGAHHWFWMQLTGGLHVPRQFRNDIGQLRMDAPYSHRDFRQPTWQGPRDEGLRDLSVRAQGRWHGFRLQHSPLDVVGWDGTVYPWAFPILNFQPRVASVHLPPTWHGTFAARGTLVCSFVPRLVDFHPEAIPCPYPHSSTHCDEIIFYCDGNFTSRRGVGAGSLSLHPMGMPHGPHPGAYERSIGSKQTSELAVMLDCFKPLAPTPEALAIEDADYQAGFVET